MSSPFPNNSTCRVAVLVGFLTSAKLDPFFGSQIDRQAEKHLRIKILQQKNSNENVDLLVLHKQYWPSYQHFNTLIYMLGDQSTLAHKFCCIWLTKTWVFTTCLHIMQGIWSHFFAKNCSPFVVVDIYWFWQILLESKGPQHIVCYNVLHICLQWNHLKDKQTN